MQRKELIVLSVLALSVGAAGGWYAGRKDAPVPVMTAKPVPTTSPSSEASPTLSPVTNKTYTDLMAEGDAERKAGRYEAAVGTYSRAIASEPKRTEAFIGRGQAYLQIVEGKKAYDDFLTASGIAPQDAEAKDLILQALVVQGRFDEAGTKAKETNGPIATYYRLALECSAGAFDSCRAGVGTLVKSNPPQDVQRKAQRIVDAFKQFDLFSDGEDAHRRTLVAEALADNADFALSERLLANVVAQAKDYRDAWILLGYSRYNLRKYDAALDALKRAQALDQKKPETAYYTGLTYLKMGKRAEAVDHLRRALDYGSTARLDIQKYLADTYVEMEDYDNALKYYLDIVNEGVSRDVTAYVRPMWVYIEIKKQPEKAVGLAQKAFDKFPNTAMGSNLLGWAQLAYGDLAEAEKNLSQALRIDPNLQAAYLNFGDLYVQQGKVAEAKRSYKQAYDLDPGGSIGTLAGTKYNSLP